jgi:hypothetical protein
MESRQPTPQSALQPVNPNECALAVAIPLSRERFLADLALPDEKDFVHHFRAERGLQRATPEFCWEVYEDREAILAEAVCREAERQGVRVCRDARLADLTDLLNRFPVVTLVAHWRFAPVEPEDISDAPRLLELLLSPETEARWAIRRAFETLDSQLLQAKTAALLSDDELRQRVAEVIRTAASEAERLYWDDDASRRFNPQQMPDGLQDRLTRREFEQAFPDCIAPARGVEFSDGMFTVPELVEAVPQDFTGLLDLTVCNSVILANSIRHRRPNCLVAANRRPAELRARIYLYGLEVSLLAKQPMPFIEVIKQVHAGQSAYKVKGGKPWNLFEKLFNRMRRERQ